MKIVPPIQQNGDGGGGELTVVSLYLCTAV